MSDWASRAACRGEGSSLFFSASYESQGRHEARVRAACEVCAGCEVRAECLAEALGRKERFGVWGGRDMDEQPKKERAPREYRCERCREIFVPFKNSRSRLCVPCLFEYREPKPAPRRRRARVNSAVRSGTIGGEMWGRVAQTTGPVPDPDWRIEMADDSDAR